jgi:hypothetical protein
MINDAELVPILKQLTGDALMKAFECVGTKAETMASLYLVLKRRGDEKPIPAVLASYSQYLEDHAKELETQSKELLSAFDENNLIPEKFIKVVKNAV